jgi:hypothetical protein
MVSTCSSAQQPACFSQVHVKNFNHMSKSQTVSLVGTQNNLRCRITEQKKSTINWQATYYSKQENAQEASHHVWQALQEHVQHSVQQHDQFLSRIGRSSKCQPVP